jgi:RNA polymerase sigma factor (sigma-70 family)
VTDSEILAGLIAGGSRAEAALAAATAAHGRMVYNACLRALGDTHAAEDAAQATFLVLLGKARSLPRGISLGGWLHRAATLAAGELRRSEERRRRREEEAATMAAEEKSRSNEAWTRIGPRIDAALDRLPSGEREVLVLTYLEGCSRAEVARQLGCAEGTVASRLGRGLSRLRERLGAAGAGYSAAALGELLAAQGPGAALPAGLTAAIATASHAGAASPTVVALTKGVSKAMVLAKIKMAAVVTGAVLAVGGGGSLAVRLAAAAAEPPAPALPAALKDAPANTWVKVLEMKTGAREQPAFVWASKAGKFVAATGQQAGGGAVPRHYDTEEFDLTQAKWTNAYPPGMEKDRPESGPVGEEYTKGRMMHGYSGGTPFYKDGEHLRPSAGGQWNDGKTYGEYCYVPEGGAGGTVYVCKWNATLAYDVAGRTWKDLGAKPREKCRLWGSMCYDPINKEILHAGGEGGSADISTWVFDIAKNEWRKLDFGSPKLKELFAKSKDLRWQSKDLLGRTSSRHAVAETAAEAKVDLAAKAAELAAAAEKFAGEVGAAGLAGSEKLAGEVAVKRLTAAAAAVKAAGPALVSPITPEKIASVRSAREIFEQAVDALWPEPPGRARSQIAFDAAAGKIVLFGGDGLDRTLSDTWVYDCKTRSWEQRFPAKSPAPRAGHITGWLPGAKRIVIAGGYSRTPLAQEIWTYDTGANAWTPLMKGAGPSVGPREFQVGAVADGDVLVCQNGGTIWGAKIDPAKPAAGAETAATAPAPGSYTWNTLSPEIWEKAAKPDPAAAKKFLDDLPVNQWTTFKFPKYAPGATNRWGTSAYDTDRHQFLLWGGGHATSHEDDVAHFSLLGGFWTIGYHPDDPIENVYAEQPTPLSFHDRRHVPIHAYKAYTYDPTAGKMFYFDRAYNPLVREWEPAPFPGLSHNGPMHSHIKATPAGAVILSEKGLFRFDAKAGAWQKLPWTGATKPFGMWCDGPCMVYDSKRNCLWIAFDKDIYKYDFASGAAEKVAMTKPKAIPQWIWSGEAVYLPDADLVLAMCASKKPDGKTACQVWDPNDAKFYWADVKWSDGSKEVGAPGLSWSDAMAYDPELKLALINNSSAQKVWGLKFDRKAANLEEIKD